MKFVLLGSLKRAQRSLASQASGRRTALVSYEVLDLVARAIGFAEGASGAYISLAYGKALT
jgi:hypothetical protein